MAAFRTLPKLLDALPLVGAGRLLLPTPQSTMRVTKINHFSNGNIKRLPLTSQTEGLRDSQGLNAVSGSTSLLSRSTPNIVFQTQTSRLLHSLCCNHSAPSMSCLSSIQGLAARPGMNFVPSRSVVKFSMKKGRRKTVKTVIRRFYRLDWGIWIRPKSGRNRHLWKKGKLRRKRIRQHVFCNSWQTRVLERMTTKYWHKKKYFVEDPYNPYHTRDNFWITNKTKNIKDQLV